MKRSRSLKRCLKQLALSSKEAHQRISEQLSYFLSEITSGYTCDQKTVSDIVVKASVEGLAPAVHCWMRQRV